MTLPLRDHPQLIIGRLLSWPPIWVHTRSLPYKTITGEIGVFTGTRVYELPTRLFVQMDYEQQPYIGLLLVKDTIFSRQLHDLLQKHVGLSIKEIGDLDLSHTL